MFTLCITKIEVRKSMPMSNTIETMTMEYLDSSSEEVCAMTLKKEIIKVIEHIFSDEEFGFETYISMKNNAGLKRFILERGKPSDRNDLEKNFNKKIQQVMVEVVKGKFLGEEVEYDTIDYVSDNQKKFYVIEQNVEYNPFASIQVTPEQLDALTIYRAEERENAEGIFFCFRRGQAVIWVYQFLYPNAIPNRKGNGFHLFQEGDVFTELKKPLLLISRRVDLLIMGNKIITDNINLLQRNFKFEEFVRNNAQHVVENIKNLNLVTNTEKLVEYIDRSKPSYARKMLRIKDSKVLQMPKDELYRRIATLPRWRGKFDVNESTQEIMLNTYKQVEDFIDLFDERYTRSDVTGEEYDTGVKKWISPIE